MIEFDDNTKEEKERRWLLRRLPEDLGEISEHVTITQFYTPDGKRYRQTYNHSTDEERHEVLKKVAVARGINHEIGQRDIDYDEYQEARKDAIKEITKYRHILKVGKYNVEIDEFADIRLVIMEIEGVDMRDTITFPNGLEDDILIEVTGNPKFSNFNLALPVEKIVVESNGEEF